MGPAAPSGCLSSLRTIPTLGTVPASVSDTWPLLSSLTTWSDWESPFSIELARRRVRTHPPNPPRPAAAARVGLGAGTRLNQNLMLRPRAPNPLLFPLPAKPPTHLPSSRHSHRHSHQHAHLYAPTPPHRWAATAWSRLVRRSALRTGEVGGSAHPLPRTDRFGSAPTPPPPGSQESKTTLPLPNHRRTTTHRSQLGFPFGAQVTLERIYAVEPPGVRAERAWV